MQSSTYLPTLPGRELSARHLFVCMSIPVTTLDRMDDMQVQLSIIIPMYNARHTNVIVCSIIICQGPKAVTVRLAIRYP